jgi:hypothetical protein
MLGHVHILCITVRDNRIICCQIFCDLLFKSASQQWWGRQTWTQICRFLVVGNIFCLETCMNSLVKVPPYSKFNFLGKIFFTQNWCNITLTKWLLRNTSFSCRVNQFIFAILMWYTHNLPEKSSNVGSRAYPLHYCTGQQNYLLSNIWAITPIALCWSIIKGRLLSFAALLKKMVGWFYVV